jgi:hypothetical protein
VVPCAHDHPESCGGDRQQGERSHE